jgi:hypothetical protein
MYTCNLHVAFCPLPIATFTLSSPVARRTVLPAPTLALPDPTPPDPDPTDPACLTQLSSLYI